MRPDWHFDLFTLPVSAVVLEEMSCNGLTMVKQKPRSALCLVLGTTKFWAACGGQGQGDFTMQHEDAFFPFETLRCRVHSYDIMQFGREVKGVINPLGTPFDR